MSEEFEQLELFPIPTAGRVERGCSPAGGSSTHRLTFVDMECGCDIGEDHE